MKDPKSDTAYRPDIDGLRALAVLAVIGFHAFPGVVRGGFVGVDVFFVISGFLITGIILREADGAKFSYRDFYARRIRRIFPALSVVLCASVALSWFVMLPHEFQALGRQVVASAFFVPNLLLWSEAGYFETASEYKPLLHLWSLGVEEQFYILWPAFVMAMIALGARRAIWIAAIGLASFAANVWIVDVQPESAFFLPFTRFWELMLGALLAVRHVTGKSVIGVRLGGPVSNVVATAGLVLIAVSVFLFGKETVFPGWAAVMPTLGTAMVVAAGQSAWLNAKLLAWRPAVYVGLISYPLYLWHWPLLSLWSIVVSDIEHDISLNTVRTVKLACVAVSFLLAAATYHWIELRVRRERGAATQYKLIGSVAVAGIVGALVVVHPAARLDSEQTRLALAAVGDWDYLRPEKDGLAWVTKNGNPIVLIVGDSHAEMYYSKVKHVLRAADGPVPSVAFLTAPSCLPMPGLITMPDRGQECAQFAERWKRAASDASVRRVILIAYWHGYADTASANQFMVPRFGLLQRDGSVAMPASQAEALRRLLPPLRQLRALGKELVIIASVPTGQGVDPRLMSPERRVPWVAPSSTAGRFAGFLPRQVVDAQRVGIEEILQEVASETGARLVRPVDYLCGPQVCVGQEGGVPLYKDSNHLRPFAAVKYAGYLDALLTMPGPPVTAP